MMKPALSLAAVPGRRSRTLELATEIESRGFSGIFTPSLSDNLALCVALALKTKTIQIGTSISPIYLRTPAEFANTASFVHEVSNGRFLFGVGVSHEPAMTRQGISPGKPLGDMRDFVRRLKSVPRAGELPPLVLATLRRRMIALSEEVADGMVFANGVRSHMDVSLSALTNEARSDDGFFIGNMIPTCINDDVTAAKAVNRRTLTSYAQLPNYRNYWREAGFETEMSEVEDCMAEGRIDDIPDCLSDEWLAQTTLFGPANDVREGIEAWFDAGIRTPIIVPSAVSGGQFQAFKEFFAIWD